MKCLSFLFILCCFAWNASSQNFEAVWPHGDGQAVDFSGGTGTFGSFAMSTPDGTYPGAICDNSGSLLFACNGAGVFGADGNVLPAGTLLSTGLEHIFIPNPANQDQYYLIKSNSSGVDYTLVDSSLGAFGDVLVGEKEVSFWNLRSRILATAKPNGGYWLILMDNLGEAVNFHVFTVDATGIVPEGDYSFTYIWADWFDDLDDVALSSDCTTIAAAFKGHYVSIFEFDQDLGSVSDPLGTAVDTGDGFGGPSQLAFSPDGTKLYTSGVGVNIQQYDLTVMNLGDILSSETTIINSATTGMVMWSDMKPASDGKLYILDTQNNKIDVLENPNASGAAAGYQSGAWTGTEDLRTSFPLTTNFNCASIVALSISGEDVCMGEPTPFTFFGPAEVTTLDWQFGDVDNTAFSGMDPQFTYSDPGTYSVVAEVEIDGELIELTTEVTVSSYPAVDLGEDQTICAGDTLILQANEVAETYNWNTGAITEGIAPNETGWYALTAANGVCSTTDSVYIEVLPLPMLQVSEDILLCEPGTATFEATSDETTTWSTGETGPSITTAVPGTYTVSAANDCGTLTESVEFIVLELDVDLGPDIVTCENDVPPLVSNETTELYLWNTGANSQSITPTETGWYSVTAITGICSDTDSIYVELLAFPTLEVSEDVILCEPGSATFTAASNADIQWSNGSSANSITVGTPNTYAVTAENGCGSLTEEVDFTVIQLNPNPLPPVVSGCFGDTVLLDPDVGMANVIWSTGQTSAPIFVTESDTYFITFTLGPCTVTDEVIVDLQENVDVTQFIMPNIFTPNADLANSNFRPFDPNDPALNPCSLEGVEVRMNMYNRWGNLIEEDACSWDGRADGDDVAAGTYYYEGLIQGGCGVDQKEKVVVGYVEVVR